MSTTARDVGPGDFVAFRTVFPEDFSFDLEPSFSDKDRFNAICKTPYVASYWKKEK